MVYNLRNPICIHRLALRELARELCSSCLSSNTGFDKRAWFCYTINKAGVGQRERQLSPNRWTELNGFFFVDVVHLHVIRGIILDGVFKQLCYCVLPLVDSGNKLRVVLLRIKLPLPVDENCRIISRQDSFVC